MDAQGTKSPPWTSITFLYHVFYKFRFSTDLWPFQIKCIQPLKLLFECRKTAKNGNAYLDIVLSDKSGEIFAKLWDYNEVSHGKYENDMFVKIRGTILKYNGNDQLRIEKIRPVTNSDNVNVADYVKSADYDGKEMFDSLVSKVSAFQDEELKKIVLYLLDSNKEKILFYPAAYRLHHAIRCGLLMHTASIVKLCEGVCLVYPFVNQELLISGAILHDIAKTVEFSVRETGLASGYTVEGNLIGHLVKGAMMVEEAAKKLVANGVISGGMIPKMQCWLKKRQRNFQSTAKSQCFYSI